MAIAKANGLDLELVNTNPNEGVTDDYRKLNKLGKVPTFEGSDGYVLSEAIAIAVYGEFCSSARVRETHRNDDPNSQVIPV